MPTHFQFRPDDGTVLEGLDEATRAEVVQWQSPRLDYQFSFHTQHEAGWPCYLKERGGPGRNLPKMNLLEGAYDGTLLQGSSVVDQHVAKDFKRVIAANLAAFRTLAERYYEGVEEVVVEVHRPPVWVVNYRCGTGALSARGKDQRVRLPADVQSYGDAFWANFRRYAKSPTCTQHRKTDCMSGEALQINDLELQAIRKVLDRNGDIHDVA